MSRKKRTSRILEKAEMRSSGLRAIDPQLDFGKACTLSDLNDTIAQFRTKIEAYNTALTIVDFSKTEIADLEKALGDLVEKMLLGVAFKYGKDSLEYEMAGGVRKSDRIRRSTNSRIKAKPDQEVKMLTASES